ncbi:hypothetical protein METH_04130 [Leisingera methylohalidivorans DSM 14336]|uniref:Uncharacterized protein n=1 Tax=Leisingera methylohalidivorans DSM 14336 TaxID=999552 RepID=V9VY60_9RHOB|nr:hypothetical protein METH_04130 [Leisingera methylohalidivorans DSM 14336]
MAPALAGFQGWAFLRDGMMAAAPRAAIAPWHFRVPYAPSAVTLPIFCSGGIWPVPLRYGRLTFRVFRRRHHLQQSGTAQSSPTSGRRLSANPAVCRSGMPNMAFNARQVWIAASLKRCCLPRLPLGGGVQIISGSNPIARDPRRLGASLQDDQFVVL